MANEPSPNDLKNLWQEQKVEIMRFSVDEIRRKADTFRSKIRRRNIREYLGAAFVVLASSWYFVTINKPIPRISFALMIAGTLYVAYRLYRMGSARETPAGMGYATGLNYYRSELERQRDLLRRVWSWYLAPLIPGLALLIGWSLFSAPPARRWYVAAYMVVAAALFWGIAHLNKRAAQRLDRRIMELNAMEDQSA
jgi:hypothetical protein